jgi:hypothetical protein
LEVVIKYLNQAVEVVEVATVIHLKVMMVVEEVLLTVGVGAMAIQ